LIVYCDPGRSLYRSVPHICSVTNFVPYIRSEATKQSPSTLSNRFLPHSWGLLRCARNDRLAEDFRPPALAPSPQAGAPQPLASSRVASTCDELQRSGPGERACDDGFSAASPAWRTWLKGPSRARSHREQPVTDGTEIHPSRGANRKYALRDQPFTPPTVRPASR
jgi:hypothetical protein